ncbi:MAG: hypothetical protein HY317_01605 [Acidobacteria bacterium]|nr:hypothetical protein [Acidobacteriota bacterium]
MKKVLIVLVLLGIAYGVGYWPQRQGRAGVEERLARTEADLATAQARVRLAAILGQLLTLSDVVEAKNYGTAQEMSSRFFDAVRQESERTPEAAFKATLESILQMRDPVTAGLTRGDAATLELLRGFETRLRNALGFAPPPQPSASPAPTPVT